MDFTVYEQLDCRAESAHSIRFAKKQGYEMRVIKPLDQFNLKITLKFSNYNPSYFAFKNDFVTDIRFKNHYNCDVLSELQKMLEGTLGQHFQIVRESNRFLITSLQAGSVPSQTSPELYLASDTLEFEFQETEKGSDCFIFIKKQHRNLLHIPKTTMGPNYKLLRIGDRVLIIDSLGKSDVTLSREVIRVQQNAECTCDIITLDRDIDRLEEDEVRLSGVGLGRPAASSTFYCANFDKVSIFVRRANFREILKDRKPTTIQPDSKSLFIPIQKSILPQNVAENIVDSMLSRSQNPWLADQKVHYYGTSFPWKIFKKDLQCIYELFEETLEDNLLILTSNRNRPDYLVHIDGFPEDVFKASLCWPVKNCAKEDNFTIWYDVFHKEKLLEAAFERNRTVKAANEISFREIGRFQFDSFSYNPVLFRHDKWHTVYNLGNSEEVRSLLQWRFKSHLTWENVQRLTQKIQI